MPSPPSSSARGRRAAARRDPRLRKVLERTHRAFRAASERMECGGDPEAIHDARVALRRARAALRLWRAPAPAAAHEALAKELRRAARALSSARDAEVVCDAFRLVAADRPRMLRPALAAHAKALRAQRAAARTAARTPCAPGRLRRLHRLWSAAETLHSIPPDMDARLRARLRRDLRRVRRTCPECAAPPAQWHAFRIRVKKCRYALEYGRSWGVIGKRAFARTLADIQRLLGEAHDFEQLRAGLGTSGALTPEARAWLERRIVRAQHRRFRMVAKQLNAAR
jgi:triphosphatase